MSIIQADILLIDLGKANAVEDAIKTARKVRANLLLVKAHWRAEIAAQLRRAGLSVPLWVKDFGKP